ncbi:membrane protein [Bordetella ansorpii]|uniref:Membrane protein n=1 Tax=Bordetella ansorpii TaxID=288768 RepID=A0A157LS51_9BORD|nr:DMT family transporter [Bordetella ansorpii]SAH99635.1 membrane protein [Bordetella ansorpii]
MGMDKSRAADSHGWLILLLPPLLWAGNFIVGRAVRADVPPMMLAFARHVVAFACVLPFGWAVIRRDWRQYWRLRWLLVRTGLAGLAMFSVLVYIGLHHTTAANGQLLNSTIPVLVLLMAALFFGQKLVARQVVGLALSCVGVLTIITHGDLAGLLALSFSEGDLIVFGAMASFALYSLWLRSVPPSLSRIGLLTIQLGITVVALLPLAVIEYRGGARTVWSATSVAAILYVGIVASLLANLLYSVGVARIGPAKASLFIHLLPVYGALMAVGFLGESLHLYHAIGISVIIAGLALSRTAPPATPATGQSEGAPTRSA